MKQEPNWMRRLRAAVKQRPMQRVGADIGYSKAAISLVLSGKYSHNTTKMKARVLERLKPTRIAKPRKARPPQLQELDSVVHANLKKLANHLAAKSCAELFGIDQARIWPLIRGTDKLGGADVIEKLQSVPFSELAAA